MNDDLFEAIKRLTVGIAPRLMRLETDQLARLEIPLTHRQYRILFQIHSGRDTATAVREVAATSLAAISESVESLHRRGLLTRANHDGDRRVYTLSLTEEGRRALESAEAAVGEIVASVLKDLALPDREASTYVAALERINNVVTLKHRQLGQSKRR